MTSKLFSVFLTSILLLGLFSATSARTRTYEDERGEYVLELPSPSWRIVRLNGIAHPRTEILNGKRSPVLLRIRKDLMDPAVFTSDMVRRQQRWDSLYLPGYMLRKNESFAGRLSGTKYSYEYVKDGMPVAGLIYYLQANNGFIYRIQFTGSQQRVWDLRDEIDFIARSFRLKYS